MQKFARHALHQVKVIGSNLENNLNGLPVASARSSSLRMLSSQGAEPSGSSIPYPPVNPKPTPDPPGGVLDRPALVEGFKAVPKEPKFLGLAGAIPFLALAPPIAAGIPIIPADLVANAATLQIGYGAVIASFLGGIHWSMAMASFGKPTTQDNADRYIWSVIPALMAWPALVMQPGPGSLVVGSTLGVAYLVDRSFAKRHLLPSWYMALRLPLTLAAVTGMAITCSSSLLGTRVPEKGPPVVPAEMEE